MSLNEKISFTDFMTIYPKLVTNEVLSVQPISMPDCDWGTRPPIIGSIINIGNTDYLIIGYIKAGDYDDGSDPKNWKMNKATRKSRCKGRKKIAHLTGINKREIHVKPGFSYDTYYVSVEHKEIVDKLILINKLKD